MEHVFRPLADLVVRVLLPLRVPPPAVVLANATAGFLAAAAIWQGELVAGALLLQLKTLLDNADGQLARAAGKTSALGRYLDTVSDLAVNAALFVALGAATGRWWLALSSFVTLMFVLSVDFNLEALYRRARGDAAPPPADESGGAALVALRFAYDAVFAPQDRLIRASSEARLARQTAGTTDPALRRRTARAYYDDGTATVLANFGLSTQLAALGVFLLAGAPGAYLWVPLACLVTLPVLQLRRERRARAVVRPS